MTITAHILNVWFACSVMAHVTLVASQDIPGPTLDDCTSLQRITAGVFLAPPVIALSIPCVVFMGMLSPFILVWWILGKIGKAGPE